MLYLDHSATTPPYDEVIEAVADVMKHYYGNPSSLHRIGLEAERLLVKAREVISAAIAVQTNEIIFTSGGTESNNLAIKGAAMAYQSRGRHLITSMIEHPSVLQSFQQLEKSGFRVTYLPVDESGQVRVEDLQQSLDDQTTLVSIMHVNNEMGRIQPIKQIGTILKDYPRILFHVDAVQGFGKLPLDPQEIGIDLMSVSAHKIHGPKGIGFLYCRKNVHLTPVLSGGGQEFDMRSGTENVPLIVGMAKAVRLASERLDDNKAKLSPLRYLLVDRISHMPQLQLSGSAESLDMAPHIVHFCCPGMKSEVIVHALEQDEIFISTRSACASGDSQASAVLTAMGMDRERASSGLRVSFSAEHTMQDIEWFCQKLKMAVERYGS